MKFLEAIIFDLDGTLIHSAPDIQFASNEALKSIGRNPLDINTIISFIGNGSEVLVDRIIDVTGGGNEVLKHTTFKTFMEVYEKNITRFTVPYPGVVNALAEFKANGIKLGICTNKPNKAAIDICDKLGIANYFDTITGAVVDKPKKPDPFLLKKCIKTLETTIDNALFVGDSTIDFNTAVATSIDFKLYSGGYLNEPYPDFSKLNQFSDWNNHNITYA